MPNVSDNWCPEIYRSIFVDRINDDKIEIAPCCQSTPQAESVDSFDFTTSPYLNELRQQFSVGGKPSACDRCWHAESNGQKSRRQGAIEFFNMQEYDDTVILNSIDYSATWACNLSCIMCGPHVSSSWAKELNLNKAQLRAIGRQYQKSNNFLNKIDISEVKKIHFNGGEPLLNDDQFVILEELDQIGRLDQVVISYNTNGTVYPSQRLLDLWSKTKLVKIFFSIDGIDKSFEYIRWPAKWDSVKSNMLKMKEQLSSNVMFGFNTTVGSYNIFEIVEIYNWFENNLGTNREGDSSDFSWQLAYNFDPKFLSQHCKEIAILQLINIPQLQGIAMYLKEHLSSIESNNWIDALDQIDQRRSTSWKNSLRVSQYY